MELLAGFLIGLALPPGAALVVASMVVGGARPKALFRTLLVTALIGIGAWAAVFVIWGVAAGLLAIIGWVAGWPVAVGVVFCTGRMQGKRFHRNRPWREFF